KKYQNGNYVGDRAIRWDTNGWTELNGLSPGAGLTYPNGINSTGTIVGTSAQSTNGSLRPVRWDPGSTTATELDSLNMTARFGVAAAVNAAGTTIGWSDPNFASNYGSRPSRWSAGATAIVELGNMGLRSDGFGGANAY